MLHDQYSDLSGHFFSIDAQPRPPADPSRANRATQGPTLREPDVSGSKATVIGGIRRSPEMALEAMVHELHNAALLTCVVTSWANGIANRSQSAPPQSVETFLPRDPRVFLTISRWERDTGISREALASADAFFRSLPPCQAQLRTLQEGGTGDRFAEGCGFEPMRYRR